MYHGMDTPEPKIKINARIDASLHKWILAEGMTVSQATQEGITLLREKRSGASDTNGDNGTQGGTPSNTQARDTKYPDNDVVVSQALRERIEDLRKQIDLMSDQLGRKDDQITQLNEVTQKQAVHIQSLIQETSKLNTKLLPEATEKKAWWKIW
jgi:uncharacterized protein involved in exopolysaccharide biosynthesis